MKANHLFAMTFALTALTACVKDQFDLVDTQGDKIPICVNSSIKQEATKATAEGFVDGDAVGLFAVNYNENNSSAGTLAAEGNQADNVKYVFDESNHKWAPVRGVYYKDINTHADLYLYYPYQASIINVNAAGFEVQKDQSAAPTATSLGGYEASDFLWGKATDVTPSQSAVSIALNHKLSSVQVTLAEGEGFEQGEYAGLTKSIILTNTTRKATINYATGEVTPLGSAQQDGIVMCPQDDGSWRAIAVPQTVAAGTKVFAITVNGVAYAFKPSSPVEFQSGKQTNFTITVKKKTPTGDYELILTDTQITDWVEDRNSHGGEARQYFVVNVETPGTLQATIEAAGKIPSKIKNLKIIGIVNDIDFYYMKNEMTILEAVNMKETMVENNIIPDKAFDEKTSLCYFVFPGNITRIGGNAFKKTTISGALIIPETVEEIGDEAFSETSITSIEFNNETKYIGSRAFYNCKSLTGKLILPEALIAIGSSTFYGCDFNGDLFLPENLERIGSDAFYRSGAFSSGLKLPEKMNSIDEGCFRWTTFKGGLDLNNCISVGQYCFEGCHFKGPLIVPEGTVNIESSCFAENNFSRISFPESLRSLKDRAFALNYRLEEIDLKEGLISIGEGAFKQDAALLYLSLPSSLQTIQSGAFSFCYFICNISCGAIEPPTIQSGVFDGVAKDNFALEVPEQSIIRYQTESGWSDFKRITAHYDFSISRSRIRALNSEMQRTYTLRCPADYDWIVSDNPDWITVSPSSGRGKTDITITVSAMPRTDDIFEVNVGSFQYPNYQNYKGRKDTVVFCLSEKEYTCQLEVEQYDYDKYDGEVITHQTKTKGNGIDIVFIGEGYDAKDIVDGKFETDCANGFTYFFNIEPYTTYRNYFNVYSVISQSDESGIETVNTILDNKFMKNGVRDINAAFQWAKRADANMDLSKTVVILLDNSTNYYGNTYLYADGSALSIVPHSEDSYPYDFRGIIQHEAGGHNFGKLGEEYILHNSYITSCVCDCCDHPADEQSGQYGFYKSLGWYKNLSMYSDHNQVPWSHLLYHYKYSNRVDMYEGAYMHTRGVYRSEATSCMNNNIPYFNSISRQAIVERIKEYAGETFDFNDFVAKDKFDVGTKASEKNFDWTFGVDPKWNRGTEEGSIIYMGDHPNVK